MKNNERWAGYVCVRCAETICNKTKQNHSKEFPNPIKQATCHAYGTFLLIPKSYGSTKHYGRAFLLSKGTNVIFLVDTQTNLGKEF